MKISLEKKLKSINYLQAFRFCVVGGVSTLIHYLVYLVALLWCGATLSYTIGYGGGFCVNYVLTTYFTFMSKATKKNFAGFMFSHVVNYSLELLVLNVIVLFINKQLAGLLTLVVVVPINYIILKFIYKGKNDKTCNSISLL